MTKSTPWARAVRTLVGVLAGFAAGWALIDWATDWRVGVTLVTLNVIAAVIAAASAYVLAYSEWWQVHIDSPLDRAIATSLQQFGTALATVVIADLTLTSFNQAGRAIWQIAVAAGVTFLLNFLQNSVEDATGLPEEEPQPVETEPVA